MARDPFPWASKQLKTEDGHPFDLRVRKKLRVLAEENRYQDRFEVRWKYKPDQKTLLPGNPNEEAFMQKVEDAMLVEMEEDGWCILSGVTTGNSHRVWYFYTIDPEQAEERFNIALENFDMLPIEIWTEPDTGWEEYKDMTRMGGWQY
jgi:Family of unknown function (DUF695)